MSKPITIVSGLPRSGTSLMMKMLEAGGLEVVIDGIREANEDNPNGYYEYEIAKKVKEDQSWLPDTQGKVFKMVSMLLKDLPLDKGYQYKVVFMRRKMPEILASQTKMLERDGKNKADGPTDEQMTALFTKHLKEMEEWIARQECIHVLYVWYHDVVENPGEQTARIQDFLDAAKLDGDRMNQVADRSLYRNRVTA
ncbi:MAG: sulfotransferase [Verrucomicrobiota bacterium]